MVKFLFFLLYGAVPIVFSVTCHWDLITHRTKHQLGFPPAPVFLLAFLQKCRYLPLFVVVVLFTRQYVHGYTKDKFHVEKKRKFGEISEKEGVKKHCNFKARAKCWFHISHNAISQELRKTSLHIEWQPPKTAISVAHTPLGECILLYTVMFKDFWRLPNDIYDNPNTICSPLLSCFSLNL